MNLDEFILCGLCKITCIDVVSRSRLNSIKTEPYLYLLLISSLNVQDSQRKAMFASFNNKNQFWNYLKKDRHVVRRFEDNSPYLNEPMVRSIQSNIVSVTPTKVAFKSIHQRSDEPSWLYKHELKNAKVENDEYGSKLVIHDKDKYNDLRRVYRLYGGY